MRKKNFGLFGFNQIAAIDHRSQGQERNIIATQQTSIMMMILFSRSNRFSHTLCSVCAVPRIYDFRCSIRFVPRQFICVRMSWRLVARCELYGIVYLLSLLLPPLSQLQHNIWLHGRPMDESYLHFIRFHFCFFRISLSCCSFVCAFLPRFIYLFVSFRFVVLVVVCVCVACWRLVCWFPILFQVLFVSVRVCTQNEHDKTPSVVCSTTVEPIGSVTQQYWSNSNLQSHVYAIEYQTVLYVSSSSFRCCCCWRLLLCRYHILTNHFVCVCVLPLFLWLSIRSIRMYGTQFVVREQLYSNYNPRTQISHSHIIMTMTTPKYFVFLQL